MHIFDAIKGFVKNDDSGEVLVLAEGILHTKASCSVPVNDGLPLSLSLIKSRVELSALSFHSFNLWGPKITINPHGLSWRNLLSLISIITECIVFSDVKLVTVDSKTLHLFTVMRRNN